MGEKQVPKKIYIIEAKLCPDKIKHLIEIMEHKHKQYKRVHSCALADYIVTELKSPSRIVRNVKKSTCPVLHISWLFESLKCENCLNPSDYLIDVSDERSKAACELSTRVDVKALPQQLTWDQVAKRRLNISSNNHENSEKYTQHSALREKYGFNKIYESRYKSKACITSSQPVSSASWKNDSLFERLNDKPLPPHTTTDKRYYSTQPLEPPKSDITAITDLESTTSFLPHLKSKHNAPSNNESPSDKNNSMVPKTAIEKRIYSTQPFDSHKIVSIATTDSKESSIRSVKNVHSPVTTSNSNSDKSFTTSLKTLEMDIDSAVRFSLSSKNRNVSASLPVSSPSRKKEKRKNYSVNKPTSFKPKDVIVITDSEDESHGLLPASDNAADTELYFSISCPYIETSSNHSSTKRTSVVKDHVSCSVEEITRNLSSSSFDEATVSENVYHSCGSVSSIDLNSKQLSVSEILSL